LRKQEKSSLNIAGIAQLGKASDSKKSFCAQPSDSNLGLLAGQSTTKRAQTCSDLQLVEARKNLSE